MPPAMESNISASDGLHYCISKPCREIDDLVVRASFVPLVSCMLAHIGSTYRCGVVGAGVAFRNTQLLLRIFTSCRPSRPFRFSHN
jgi:hypothetical protein